MRKFLWRSAAAIGILALGFILFVQLSWHKTFEAPLPPLSASTDSVLIARGKYLAFGPAHCATCHVPMDKIPDIEAGKELPLSGGWEINIPPGIFRAPNLTPDPETGIGRLSDGQIARALRHSVNHRGEFMMPFMPFQDLSDEDVVAIISFLRTQPAVKHEVPRSEYTFFGKMLLALGALSPVGPKTTPPVALKKDSTVVYGAYVAHSVANCNGCHTKRDFKTGAFVGAPLAGGTVFEPDPFTDGYAFVAPNLTPDVPTGVMAEWSETAFINRFRAGRVHKGSHMPWGVFARMDEVELKAVYRYLQSLQPVNNLVEKTVYAPGEVLPK